jgi:predicted O-methyltransferase YrrM
MIKTVAAAKLYTFGLKWTASWASVNWHYTRGLLSPHSRSVIYGICNLLGMDDLGRKKAALPKVPCDAVLEKLTAHLLSPEPIDGNVSLFELMILCSVAKEHGVRSAFEIGTFNGRTALNLALNMPRGATVYTLDLPSDKVEEAVGVLDKGDVHYVNHHTPGELFRRFSMPDSASITQLLGDSAAFDYSSYAGKQDLVFIDGAHSYDYVKRDTETAFSLLRDGKGFIFWHDYDACVGVIELVDELQQKHPEYNLRHIMGTKLAYLHKT